MHQIKFDTLKAKAIKMFDEMIVSAVSDPTLHPAIAELPVIYAQMSAEDRRELREFVKNHVGLPARFDWIEAHAVNYGNRFAQMLLKIREDGHKIIDNWDVRAVRSLINKFPGIVPKHWLDLKIVAEDVDNPRTDDSEWVIFFGTPDGVPA